MDKLFIVETFLVVVRCCRWGVPIWLYMVTGLVTGMILLGVYFDQKNDRPRAIQIWRLSLLPLWGGLCLGLLVDLAILLW